MRLRSETNLRSFLALVALTFGGERLEAQTRYVDASLGNDANPGSLTSRPYRTLTRALSAASSDPTITDIKVAEGIYRPGSSRTDSFHLVRDVRIEGGYQSGSSFGVRDIDAYRSVLSGAIGRPGRLDDVQCIVQAVDVEGVFLDGFTIRDGYGGRGTDGGAGLYLSRATIAVSRCRFVRCEAPLGGAVRVDSGVDVGFWSCTFLSNVARDGGAIEILSGAGNDESDVFANQCEFLGNRAESYGGAIETVVGNLQVWNSAFVGNVAGSRGGAIAISGYPSTTLVTNCSLTLNHADRGGAAYVSLGSLDLRNSILWDDSAVTDPEISTSSSGSLSVQFCCLAGAAAFGGTANFDEDPHFIDADGADDLAGTEDDDVRIPHPGLSLSPCVDAGENAFIGGAHLQLDLDGDPRKRAPWLWGPSPAIVDVGAHEVGPLTIVFPGTRSDLLLQIEVNGRTPSLDGSDRVHVHGNDLLDMSLLSPRGAHRGSLGLVALEPFFAGQSPVPFPLPGFHVGPGSLVIASQLVPFATFQGFVSPPGLSGQRMMAQGIALDPGAQAGYVTTNGREVVFH